MTGPHSSNRHSPSPHVAVIGGGLAGITAAIALRDAGVKVTLLESRPRLGGAASSYVRGQLTVDNGQHVFLRCCEFYQELLARLGVTGSVAIQDRFDVTVLAPDGPARLRRSALPSPLHLARALASLPPAVAARAGERRAGRARAAAGRPGAARPGSGPARRLPGRARPERAGPAPAVGPVRRVRAEHRGRRRQRAARRDRRADRAARRPGCGRHRDGDRTARPAARHGCRSAAGPAGRDRAAAGQGGRHRSGPGRRLPRPAHPGGSGGRRAG